LNRPEIQRRSGYRSRLVTILILGFLTGCQEKVQNPVVAQEPSETEEGERLLAQPPLGWTRISSTSIRGLRTASFIPEGEEETDWTRMIKFESMTEDPLPDPIEFVELLTFGQTEQCGAFEAYPTFSGLENGYATSVSLLICHNDRKLKKSDVTMIKTIRGNDHFYVITRSKRGPPVVDDKPAIEEETIAAWSLYLKSTGVCDTRSAAHPCPDNPSH
jgi:hypothetical protein